MMRKCKLQKALLSVSRHLYYVPLKPSVWSCIHTDKTGHNTDTFVIKSSIDRKYTRFVVFLTAPP